MPAPAVVLTCLPPCGSDRGGGERIPRKRTAMRIVGTIAGASAALWAAASAAQLAEPVHVRNLNPLVSIFGLPAWDTVPIGTRFGATVEVANHYRFSLADNERLMLDGETVRTTLAFTHGFATGWSLGVELPYFRVSGGVRSEERRVGKESRSRWSPAG